MTQSRLQMTLFKKAFENILEKGENAGNQHFLLFPKYFPPRQRQMFSFWWCQKFNHWLKN